MTATEHTHDATILRRHKSDRGTQASFEAMKKWLSDYRRSNLKPSGRDEEWNYLTLQTLPHVTEKAIERARFYGFERFIEPLSEQDEQRMSLGVETTAQALHEQRYDWLRDLGEEFEKVLHRLTDADAAAIHEIIDPIIAEMDALESDDDPKQIPDFVCSHCKEGFYYPHEGEFLGKNEPDVLCQTCYLRELGVLTNDTTAEEAK